ncbi:MAG: hypothetical protein ABI151_04770 [Chitinophagaceae bacterium]
MNNLFRGLIAGYGAKKLGGGCFSTILVFVVIWYALGHCGNGNNNQNTQPRVQNTSKQVTPVAIRA